jgi:hypothetical protein
VIKVFEVFEVFERREGRGGGEKWGRDNEVRVAATLRQVILMAFRRHHVLMAFRKVNHFCALALCFSVTPQRAYCKLWLILTRPKVLLNSVAPLKVYRLRRQI